MFKHGDKIRRLDEYMRHVICQGDIVTFDIKVDGDHGMFYCEELPGIKLMESAFELVKEEKMEFKVGDKVSAFGVEGKVTTANSGYVPSFPVAVIFGDKQNAEYFMADGKYLAWHKEPSLKLIERPKQKKTVMMYPALLYSENYGYHLSPELFENETATKPNYYKSFIKLLTDHGVEVEIEID